MAQGRDITGLLTAWAGGDASALERLMPVVYQELRRIARRNLRTAGATLQASDLAHEAYLRLVRTDGLPWKDRAHFFAVAAQMMRRIAVDAARRRASAKRGGADLRVVLDEHIGVVTNDDKTLIALDDALATLGQRDPRKAKVVELRFFGGLSIEQTAAVLGISPESVMRDWRLAKPWLAREIGRESHGGR